MNEKHIKNLSNIELVENMKKLVSSERRLLVSFLAHLSEVSQRRLHLESGFSNLVDYCTTTFGISEGSAYKRMQVARASRKFPLILDYIKEQKISLTVACMLCPHLDIDNFKEKLDMAVKKTKRQLEKLIAGWVQRQEPEESIRKVPVCSSVREKNYAGSGFGGQTLELKS